MTICLEPLGRTQFLVLASIIEQNVSLGPIMPTKLNLFKHLNSDMANHEYHRRKSAFNGKPNKKSRFEMKTLCCTSDSESEENEEMDMRLQFQLPDPKMARASIWSTQSYGMASELASPTAFCSRKLFDAVREDELDMVIEELHKLKDKNEINTPGKRGTTLLHLAARYNLVNITAVLLEYGASIDFLSSVGGWTALHIACRFNCKQTALLLMSRGADPTIKSSNGSTTLHQAARKGNREIAEILLNQTELEVNAKDNAQMTPLHLACIRGDRQLCQLLLNHGANILAKAADQMTPLHVAVFSNHSKVAKLLFRKVVELELSIYELLLDTDMDNSTLLHLAAERNDIEIAELCLDHGAEVNARRTNSTTPLHSAAAQGHFQMVELLLSNGADMTAKDAESKTPFHRAVMYNRTDVVKMFLSKHSCKIDTRDSRGRTPFLDAIAAGHTNCGILLIEQGTDYYATDLSAKNCLHLAVENEHLETLNMLLENDDVLGNLNRTDWHERVPLHYAAVTKNVEVLKILLTQQQQYGFQDDSQKTPLHLAAESSSASHVSILAEVSSVNERDDKGRTPLHCAATRGQSKACVTLLSLGADVDGKDFNQCTPLIFAARMGNLKCAEILLDREASLDHQDIDGDTALHKAARYGHVTIINLLLDRGAKMTIINCMGHAFLESAIAVGVCDVAVATVKHSRYPEIMEYTNPEGITTMELLIQYFPESAEIVMNRCIRPSTGVRGSDPNYSIMYDFRLLDPPTSSSGRLFFGPHTMVKYERENLLLHPLTTELLERKWVSLGRFVYAFDLVTYFMFFLLLTVFMVDARDHMQFLPLKPVFTPNVDHTSDLAYIIALFVYGHLFKEIVQMGIQSKKYFQDFSNLLEWALYVSTAIFLIPYTVSQDSIGAYFADTQRPRSFWTVGILALFLCYMNMVLFLRRFRLFGIYISMFVEVTKTVLRVILSFSVFIFGFALAFHLLFKEQAAFRDLALSVSKVLIMMIGEMEYESTFIETLNSTSNGSPMNPFGRQSQLFLHAFVLLMAIVLMNLLVGLAVGDIEAIRRTATVKRMAMQIDFIRILDQSYPRWITKRWYKPFSVVRPNCLTKLGMFLRWIEGHVFLRPKSHDLPLKSEINNPEYAELREQLIKSKKRSKAMMKMMRTQTEMLRNILSTVDPRSEMREVVENDWLMAAESVDVFQVPDTENEGGAPRRKESKLFDETAL